MPTKLVIGDAGKNREMEWGEIYHAAAFLAAKEEHEIEVRFLPNNEARWKPALEFLWKVSSDKRVSYSALEGRKPTKSQKIQRSAEVLLSMKDSGRNVETPVRDQFLSVTGKGLPRRDRSKPESCFLWIRWNSTSDSNQDLTEEAFDQICTLLGELGINPVFIGPDPGFIPDTQGHLLDFHKDSSYNLNADPLKTLKFLHQEIEQRNIRFSIGMKSGGMDGLAFAFGLPTFFISTPSGDDESPRMKRLEEVFDAFKRVSTRYERTEDKKFTKFTEDEESALENQLAAFLAKES